jgi:hypothetical protein
MLACLRPLGSMRANFTTDPSGRTARSGLLDRCPLRVHELPAPIRANEYARPAALLVNRSVLVFSFGGGTIGDDGGIPVGADFDVIRDERIEIHAPALPILIAVASITRG